MPGGGGREAGDKHTGWSQDTVQVRGTTGMRRDRPRSRTSADRTQDGVLRSTHRGGARKGKRGSGQEEVEMVRKPLEGRHRSRRRRRIRQDGWVEARGATKL